MILEIIGFIALLGLGLYLAVGAAACVFGEIAFGGKLSALSYIITAVAGLVLLSAFYLAPFTITLGMK